MDRGVGGCESSLHPHRIQAGVCKDLLQSGRGKPLLYRMWRCLSKNHNL